MDGVGDGRPVATGCPFCYILYDKNYTKQKEKYMVMQEINPLEMASLHIVYNNMSPLDEKDGRRGIFHLIEHMIGTVLDPILPELHEYAILDDLMTSHEHVIASFSGTAEAMEKFAHRIINKIVSASSKEITEEMFEMERDAVYNEIAEIGSDFNATMLRDGLRKVYGIHSPEGVIKDVRKYTFDQFKKDFDKYVPHPSSICYVGPRSIDLPDLAKNPYSGAAVGKFPTVKMVADAKAKRSDIAIDAGAEYVGISAFGTKPVTTDKEYAALNIACRIIGGDADSAMFTELRTHRHLVYSFNASVEPFRKAALPIFFTSASADKAPEVISCMKNILENADKYVSEEQFNRCKNMLNMVLKQQNIMRFTAPGNLTRLGMINDELETPKITYKYMLRVIRKYFGKNSFRFFAAS